MTHAQVLVFFVTVKQTAFMCETFTKLKLGSGKAGFSVFEMHSDKSQSNRTRVSKAFREAERGVMFSSDVSARGLDYPNVTHVFQVGSPMSREQYIHRLGRTARAGKSGKCVLLLHEWEVWFRQQLTGLSIEELPGGVPQCPWPLPAVTDAVASTSGKARRKCFISLLGYYVQLFGVHRRSKAGVLEKLQDVASRVLGTNPKVSGKKRRMFQTGKKMRKA